MHEQIDLFSVLNPRKTHHLGKTSSFVTHAKICHIICTYLCVLMCGVLPNARQNITEINRETTDCERIVWRNMNRKCASGLIETRNKPVKFECLHLPNHPMQNSNTMAHMRRFSKDYPEGALLRHFLCLFTLYSYMVETLAFREL